MSDYESDNLSNYITCELLLRLGYCLNLHKTIFEPTPTPTFWVYSRLKGTMFQNNPVVEEEVFALREHILTKNVISVLDLQKFAGRAISFMLAVPTATLYIREINAAISLGIKGNRIFLDGDLLDEIMYWQFLDNWEGKVLWKQEHHLSTGQYIS